METFPCGVIYLWITCLTFLTFVTFLGDRLFFKLFAKPLRSPVRANYNWIPLKGTHRPIRPIYFWSLGVNCRRRAQGHTWGLPAGLTCRIYLKWKYRVNAYTWNVIYMVNLHIWDTYYCCAAACCKFIQLIPTALPSALLPPQRGMNFAIFQVVYPGMTVVTLYFSYLKNISYFDPCPRIEPRTIGILSGHSTTSPLGDGKWWTIHPVILLVLITTSYF